MEILMVVVAMIGVQKNKPKTITTKLIKKQNDVNTTTKKEN